MVCRGVAMASISVAYIPSQNPVKSSSLFTLLSGQINFLWSNNDVIIGYWTYSAMSIKVFISPQKLLYLPKTNLCLRPWWFGLNVKTMSVGSSDLWWWGLMELDILLMEFSKLLAVFLTLVSRWCLYNIIKSQTKKLSLSEYRFFCSNAASPEVLLA